MSKIFTVVTLTFFLILTYCADLPGEHNFKRVEVFKYGSDEWRSAISALSFDDRIDLFLFAQCCAEGGGYRYLPILEGDGEKLIPLIITRFKTSKTVRSKVDLLILLDAIDSKSGLVHSNSETMAIINVEPENSDQDEEVPLRTYRSIVEELNNRSQRNH